MAIREHDEPVKAVRRDLSPDVLRLRPTPRWGGQRLSGLAAALVIAIGAFTWGLSQQLRLQGLLAPHSVPAVVTLLPDGLRGEHNHTPLPADTPTTLILASEQEPSAFRSHEVLIEDLEGKLHSRLSGEKRGTDGSITVFLPVGLPKGEYRIQIFGVENGLKEPLEFYSASVRPRGP